MFGKFFREITGVSPSTLKNITDVEREVERVNGRKLEIVPFQSNAVPLRGSIFPYSNCERNLDAELDKALGRR